MKDKLILFVHGLGGNGLETWQNNRTGFLDLVENDKGLDNQFDVAFYQYPTSLFRLPFFTKTPQIQDLADGLRTQIENNYQDYESIILICHSLGGLIARQYLVDELKRKRPLKVDKLLLYAVPNNGAQLASVANFISWRHNQLSQLCKNSDFIEFLNEDWERLYVDDKIDIKYVVAGVDKVVDKKSAEHFWGNKIDTVIDKGHRNIVKPKGEDDISFVIFKNFVDQQREDAVSIDCSHGQEEWDGFVEFANNIKTEKYMIDGNFLDNRNKIDRTSVLILPLPFRTQISDKEVEYIKTWVKDGGGLFFLGYYAADTHHGSNPSRITREFDYEFQDNLILPGDIKGEDVRRHVFSQNDQYAVKINQSELDDHPITKGVTRIAFQSSCSIDIKWGSKTDLVISSPANSKIWTPEGPKGPEGWSRKIIEKWNFESQSSVPLLIAFEYGKGRVVISSTWKITTLHYMDNAKLVENILNWLSNSA